MFKRITFSFRGRCTSLLPVALAGLLAGAAAAGGLNPPASGAAVPEVAELSPDYRVARGDELSFRFFYVPELNTVATVRSDGRLALPLAGDLRVEGLTMAELASLVERQLSEQVRRPQVVVNVQGVGSQRIFIGGEVVRPGMQPLAGPLSALQAVMVAEGLKETAQPRKVVVLRRGPRGERLVLPVDLEAVMNGREPGQDLTLQAYDVVVVPRSGVADVNLWVDQYIKRMLPFSIGFSYSINRDGVVR